MPPVGQDRPILTARAKEMKLFNGGTCFIESVS